MTLETLRRILVGERLPTARAIHERLSKLLALPVFASDAISSSAYATEEIALALVTAGVAALHYGMVVGAAIAILFTIVAISYRQTIYAYPNGGGAYTVARENLGLLPGLIAAAALLTDYILTVAVSVAAGIAAIISAFPSQADNRVLWCLAAIAVMTLVNLRGAKESGKVFAGPVYLFVLIAALLLPVGLWRLAHGEVPAAPAAMSTPLDLAPLLLLLLLMKAFASGCAALTGIEAISNGVPAFRPPESRNAALTLVAMTGVCLVLFLGITFLAQAFHIVPDPTGAETLLSKIGRVAFGRGVLYFLLQVSTAAILILAANTSFAGFPRLASILARDGYAPRQLANLGDRLVFSNGIVLLGCASAALIIRFHGLTHLLIPLYAVGVFMSFTLSQLGMVQHWRQERSGRWRLKAAINLLGAVVTAIVLVVVASFKFLHGAWMVLVFIPLLIYGFSRIARHYRGLDRALAMEPGTVVPRALRHAVLVLVPRVHRGVLPAIVYAKTIAPDPEAVFVEVDPQDTVHLREEWSRLGLEVPLTVLKSPWRSLTEPVIRYTRTLRAEKHIDMVTVIIPEFVVSHWLHGLLHNQSGLMLKWALMFEPGVVVTNVRYRVDGEDRD